MTPIVHELTGTARYPSLYRESLISVRFGGTFKHDISLKDINLNDLRQLPSELRSWYKERSGDDFKTLILKSKNKPIIDCDDYPLLAEVCNICKARNLPIDWTITDTRVKVYVDEVHTTILQPFTGHEIEATRFFLSRVHVDVKSMYEKATQHYDSM